MELRTAKIISAPSQDFWSQVYVNGDFLTVIRLEKQSDPVSASREIVSSFQSNFALSPGGTLQKIKDSLDKINRDDVEMAVCLVRDKVLYLGILNKGRAVLFRQNRSAVILQGKEGVSVCSGFLKEGDVFIIGTEAFFEIVDEEMLAANLKQKEIEEMADILTSFVNRKMGGGAAAALIKTKGRKKINMREIKRKLRQMLRPGRERPESRKQRMMMTVAVVLSALLLVSIVLGWQKRRRDEEKRKFDKVWSELEYKYKEGRELIGLNPSLARKLLSESLEIARQNQNYKEVKALKGEIEKELVKAVKKYELTEAPVFLDLSLIKNGLKGADFNFWKKKIILLGENGTVVRIDLNKKAEILGKVEGGKLTALWGKRVFVLGEKIVEVGSKEEIQKDWGDIAAFETFAANLYLLDKRENEIWKYPLTETGFGSKKRWLGSGVRPDLSGAAGWAIDGDIWVLLENGQVLKFSRGAPKAFAVSGLDKKLASPAAIYTDEDCQKIYILDKGNERIVVLNKNGEYDSQYLWQGMAAVDKIIASESEKKILLLTKDKIYQIKIR